MNVVLSSFCTHLKEVIFTVSKFIVKGYSVKDEDDCAMFVSNWTLQTNFYDFKNTFIYLFIYWKGRVREREPFYLLNLFPRWLEQRGLSQAEARS